MIWTPTVFPIACVQHSIDFRAGYTYRGLGLHMVAKASPKGRRPPRWKLTHLGSGHGVAHIDGKVADAFPIATEVAECGDWDFDGMDGWRNRDPDLPTKVRDVLAKYPKRAKFTTGRIGGSDEAARLVLNARLGADR